MKKLLYLLTLFSFYSFGAQQEIKTDKLSASTSANFGYLTATRVPFIGASGLLTDSGSLTFNSATSTLTTTNFAGNATNATNTGITDDTSTNATMYPTWATASTGNLPQKVSSTKFTFNPSTGVIGSVGLNLSGDATLSGSGSTGYTQAPGDNSTKLATTAYVSGAVSGLSFKAAVQYATTAALPANTYANGTLGVGATLTANAVGILTVDGSNTVLNDNILVHNEAAPANNGIYVVTTAGTAGVAYVLTRRTDDDQSAEFTVGFQVFVLGGAANITTTWAYNGISSPTMGTTSLTFAQSAGVNTYTPGNGLLLSANQFKLDDTSTTLNLFGAATTLAIGGSTGTLTVGNTTLAAKAGTFSTTLAVTGLISGAAGVGAVIPNIAPAADFTLTQNTNKVPFKSVNSGAVDNTLYLSTGNVGIGKTSPSAKLDVLVASTGTQGVVVKNTNATTADAKAAIRLVNDASEESTLYTTSSTQTDGNASKTGFIYGAANGFSIINAAGAKVFNILQGGNVSIGVTNPTLTATHGIEVVGASGQSAGLRLTAGNAYSYEWLLGATNSNIGLYDPTAAAYRLYVQSDGKVGIGTTSPSARMHSLSTTEQLRLGYDASNYAAFTVGSNGILRVDNGAASSNALLYLGSTSWINPTNLWDGWNADIGNLAFVSSGTAQANNPRSAGLFATRTSDVSDANSGAMYWTLGVIGNQDKTTGTTSSYGIYLENHKQRTAKNLSNALGIEIDVLNKYNGTSISDPYSANGDGIHGLTEGLRIYSSELPNTAGTFVVGNDYRIVTVGTTNFTLIGSANNNVGTVFTATGIGTGTGTANQKGYDASVAFTIGGNTNTHFKTGINFHSLGIASGGTAIAFADGHTISWFTSNTVKDVSVTNLGGYLAVTGGVDVSGYFVSPTIKATTGTRYVCVNTDGVLVSSASGCSGT